MRDDAAAAGWQSGHAADCKSVYAGSIPTPASITPLVVPRLGTNVAGLGVTGGLAGEVDEGEQQL